MSKGKINVSVENIFPLIKQFLYSDHEIFLRELISNATDATVKLKHLINLGEAKVKHDNPKIEVWIDKEQGTLHIKDQGLGMTAEEVEKYINEVAFSGAEEFLDKYKEKVDNASMIGHFGLGFYSAFMVAERVDILTKSFKENTKAVKWSCDGSPEFTLEEIEKEAFGTEIVLHIAEDSKDFLEESKILELLTKYNRFNIIPIQFGEEEITEGEGDDAKTSKKPRIINNTNPAWTKKPSELTDEDYLKFYRELYPTQFEEPLFWIHLNVDYPFNLTGILYFPKMTTNVDVQKDKIQLYQNQVFVTDNVEGIVPEFLQMLRGVIDSPDIPLNVSRSYLQADASVKRIAKYISKKVSDKLASIYKDDKAEFEKKWNDIKVVIEYGMLTDDKFFERSQKYYLYPTLSEKYNTLDELKETLKANQTDKDDNLILLYTSDKTAQHGYIETAQNKGYEVLLLDTPIVPHLIQKIEGSNEKIKFARVDADHIDNLIKKEETKISKLDEESIKKLEEQIKTTVPKEYSVQMEPLDSTENPFIITQPEFMRRMKDMQMSGGGMMGMSNFPDMYNLIVNTNNPLMEKILKAKKNKEQYINQALDLAKLSQHLLKGEALTNFIKRSYDLM